MLCEKCKTNMIHVCENSVQGWSCPVCGWGTLTTYIDKIHQDMTEYSICTKSITNIDKDKIKVISKIAGVNYIVAKQMLEKEGICILKAKAVDIKKAIWYNVMSIPAIVLLIYIGYRYLMYLLKDEEILNEKMEMILKVFLVILIIFGISRNFTDLFY